MHWRVLILVVLLALGASSSGPVASGQEKPVAVTAESQSVRKVPAKELAIPTTVSPELARVIAQPIRKLPNPKTPDQWRAAQRALDEQRAEEARKNAAKLGVKVEETTVAGVSCYKVTPAEVPARNEGRLLVHVHGGAYVFGGGLACTGEAVLIADACKTRVISVDYRMPPDHPFPPPSMTRWRSGRRSPKPATLPKSRCWARRPAVG